MDVLDVLSVLIITPFSCALLCFWAWMLLGESNSFPWGLTTK